MYENAVQRIKSRTILHDRGYASECLEFQGHRLNGGHGQISVDGTLQLVHRVMYCAANGKSLDEVDTVRHKCDNPPCCNPDHLIEGTMLDNTRDAMARGRLKPPPVNRHLRGEDNPRSVLSDREREEIRATVGVSAAELGRRYGVNEGTIRYVRRTGKQ